MYNLSEKKILIIICGGIFIFIRENIKDHPIVTEKPLR